MKVFEMNKKEHILGVIEDLVSNFLYYDRKGDEELEVGDIEDAVENEEITIKEMVEAFEKHLTECLE